MCVCTFCECRPWILLWDFTREPIVVIFRDIVMTLWVISVQLPLRTLIYTELAKCEEDAEHLTAAIEHIKKV